MAKTVLGTFGGGSSGLPLTTVYSDGSQSVASTPKPAATPAPASVSSSTPVSTPSPVSSVAPKINTGNMTSAQATNAQNNANLMAQYGAGNYTINPDGSVVAKNSAIAPTVAPTNVLTPEQQAQQQRDAAFKQIQDQLDSQQQQSVSALTNLQVQTPVAPNYQQTFQNLQDKYGTAQIEQQIADTDAQINDLNALTQSAVSEEGKRLGPNAIIAARKSKITDEQSIELNRLQNQKVILQNTLSNKMNTINTMLQLTQQDYQTAYAQWTDNYNRQIQLQGILNQNQDKLKSDAQANLNVILGSLTGSGATFESLSPLMQSQITNLAVQAGIQPEFIPYLMQTSQGADKVITTATNDAGDVSIITQKADGTFGTQTIRGIGNAQGTGNSESTSSSNVTYQRIVSGNGNIGDLTPSEQTQVENQLYTDGFYNPSVPAWFKQQVEAQYKKSLTAEALKQLWEAYRTPIISKTKSTSSSSGTTDYGAFNLPAAVQ